MTREELWLAAIAGLEGAVPPDYPVWHYEQMLAAIYDAVTGAADPRPFPERSWHLDEFLYAVYCAVAGLDDPGCPTPTCRIEEFWRGIYEKKSGVETAAVPTPVWRIEEFLSAVFDAMGGELPDAYTRIAGIQFDGDCWYETGEVMTGDDDVTMTLDGTSTSGQNVFGSYNGTSSGTKNFSLFLYGNGSSSNCYLRYGEQLLRPRFGSGERTITFGKSGTSGFATDVTATPETFTTVATAYIGMLPNSSSPSYTGKIIGDITVGTRLKWIPCVRNSDSAVGYYEAKHHVFLEKSGTGTPTALEDS